MNIRDVAELHRRDLPGYELVGYADLGLPVYKRTIECLVVKGARLPVVQEFVLNLWNEGLNKDDIIKVLALDYQIIIDALLNLYCNNYIDKATGKIMPNGKRYLEKHKVDKLEKTEHTVYIDGLTGKYRNDGKRLILEKTIREKGLRTLRAIINEPDVDNINFSELRKELMRQQKEEEKNNINNMTNNRENNDTKQLVDVKQVRGTTTTYARTNLLVFENKEQKYRILGYDGNAKIDNYESIFLDMEAQGKEILRYQLGKYQEDKKIDELNSYINECKEAERISLIDYQLHEENYFKEATNNILIVTSLTSLSIINNEFVSEVRDFLSRGKNVRMIICGRELISKRQQNLYDELLRLKSRYKAFEIQSVPKYYHEMLVKDSKEGMCIQLVIHNINVGSSKLGVTENVYGLKKSNLDYILCDINESIECTKNKLLDTKYISKSMIQDKMRIIGKLLTEIDVLIYEKNAVGWFGEEEPNKQNLLNLPLANNRDTFKVFISEMSQSLVETLERNAKNKKVRNYFWNNFKNDYGELQHILHKIRVYRNKEQHFELEPEVRLRYLEFLEEDLDGCIPDFVEKGYIILQYQIVEQLYMQLLKMSKNRDNDF